MGLYKPSQTQTLSIAMMCLQSMQGHYVKYNKVSGSKGIEVNIYYTFYTYY